MKALMIAAALIAGLLGPIRPAAATAIQLKMQCDRTALPVIFIDGSPAFVAEYVAATKIGTSGSPEADDNGPAMVALSDAVAFFHAKASVTQDSVTLSNAQHTLSVARDTGTATLDGHVVAMTFTPPASLGGETYLDDGVVKQLSHTPSKAYAFSVVEVPVLRADGTPLPVPAICAPPKPTAAQAAILAQTHPRGPTSTHPSMWCEAPPNRVTPYTIAGAMAMGYPPAYFRNEAVNERAYAELCNGALTYAAVDYAALKTWYVTADGSKVPDFQRHYIITQSLVGNPDNALAMIEKIREPDLAKAKAAFYKGDDCGAIREFAGLDGRRQMTPDMLVEYQKTGPRPELAKAVSAVCSGDIAKAITIMRPLGGTALYDLMLGDLEARVHDWRAAAAYWNGSAEEYPNIPLPEWTDFDTGGATALEMIWYYRAHLPRS